jgi:arginine decarboxylase
VFEGPNVDPTKLVVLLHGTGADGIAVERELIARQLPVEMADRDTIIAMVTLADRADKVQALVTALIEAVESHRGEPRQVVPAAAWAVVPEPVLAPREAFFARHAVVPIKTAIGRVCAEVVAPYPPGVPVLALGERITADAVEALSQARAHGTRIAYAADPSLETLLVVA